MKNHQVSQDDEEAKQLGDGNGGAPQVISQQEADRIIENQENKDNEDIQKRAPGLDGQEGENPIAAGQKAA